MEAQLVVPWSICVDEILSLQSIEHDLPTLTLGRHHDSESHEKYKKNKNLVIITYSNVMESVWSYKAFAKKSLCRWLGIERMRSSKGKETLVSFNPSIGRCRRQVVPLRRHRARGGKNNRQETKKGKKKLISLFLGIFTWFLFLVLFLWLFDGWLRSFA